MGLKEMDDEGGGEHLRRKKIKLFVELHPSRAVDIAHGVRDRLDLFLMRYNERYGGVVMSLSDEKILAQQAHILTGLNPYIRIQVSAVITLFCPVAGQILEGTVNYVGHDHIGLVMLEHFKASIRGDCIRGDLQYNIQTNSWISEEDEEHSIATGANIRFMVESVQVDGDFLDIFGSLLPEGTGSIDWLDNRDKRGTPRRLQFGSDDSMENGYEEKQRIKEEKRRRKEEKRKRKEERTKRREAKQLRKKGNEKTVSNEGGGGQGQALPSHADILARAKKWTESVAMEASPGSDGSDPAAGGDDRNGGNEEKREKREKKEKRREKREKKEKKRGEEEEEEEVVVDIAARNSHGRSGSLDVDVAKRMLNNAEMDENGAVEKPSIVTSPEKRKPLSSMTRFGGAAEWVEINATGDVVSDTTNCDDKQSQNLKKKKKKKKRREDGDDDGGLSSEFVGCGEGREDENDKGVNGGGRKRRRGEQCEDGQGDEEEVGLIPKKMKKRKREEKSGDGSRGKEERKRKTNHAAELM